MNDPYELVNRRESHIQSLISGPEVPTRRVFSDPALQCEVDRLFATLPDDRRAAEVEVGGDQQGIFVAVGVKLDAGWSIRGGISYDITSGAWGGKIGFRWVGK